MTNAEIHAVAIVIRKFAGYYRYLRQESERQRANNIVCDIVKAAGYGHLLKEPTQ